ncbi:hypothetical protein SUGI_0754550 [Cryptomeria japonica]|nr:hypothetical protein SUGI_0754550 [Cryptomeria japonica]
MLTLIISGGPLQVGFVDTQGQAFIDILHPGDVTIFSRGTLHFELNVGTEEANYISALNSQNPGVVTSSVYPLPWAKTQEAEFSHCAFMAREKFQWMMYTDVGEFVLSDSWLNEQDRTPGLSNKAIQPDDWEHRFCEVIDTALKDFAIRVF